MAAVENQTSLNGTQNGLENGHSDTQNSLENGHSDTQNGLENGHSDQEIPGINVFKEYMLQLLPHNPNWIKGASSNLNKGHVGDDIVKSVGSDLTTGNKQIKQINSIEETDCPLEIGSSDVFGRYIKAKRNIAPGEVLAIEPPVVLTTRPKSPPHCTTCYRITSDFKCPECGFFLCSEECLTAEHKMECQFLKRLGLVELSEESQREEELISKRLSDMPAERREEAKAMLQKAKAALTAQKHQEILHLFVIMATLRTAVAFQQSEFLKTLVLLMQANLDPGSQRYQMNQKLIVDVIVNKLKFPVDSAMLHQICSIWDTNAFQVVLPHNGRVQGLYPFAALMNHTCRPNAQQWFASRGEMVLRAVDHINEGDMVTISYTDPQWCTVVRQNHLQKCKQFTCTCRRCNDPSELGTFIGSITCPSCGCPLVSSAPLDTSATWVCTSTECPQTLQAIKIISKGAQIAALTQRIDPNDVKAVVSLAQVLQKQVHPNHYGLLQLYISVINNLVNKDLAELSDEELSRLSGITAQVMRVVRALQPPFARITASMAREDLRLQLEKMKRDKRSGDDIKQRLEAISSHLMECAQVLDWDPSMPTSDPLKQVHHDLIISTS